MDKLYVIKFIKQAKTRPAVSSINLVTDLTKCKDKMTVELIIKINKKVTENKTTHMYT